MNTGKIKRIKVIYLDVKIQPLFEDKKIEPAFSCDEIYYHCLLISARTRVIKEYRDRVQTAALLRRAG